MALPYDHELRVAELAVQKAVLVTRRVLALGDRGTLLKPNDTPVSLGDLAAQSLLIAAIRTNFPADRIIGEEDADALRRDPAMADRSWELVSTTRLDDDEAERLLGSPTSKDEMLRIIDAGVVVDDNDNHFDDADADDATATAWGGDGHRHRSRTRRRVWTIDPIDGTKGYLAGGQYAVCVALLVDGVDQVAAFGCPHVNPAEGRVAEKDADLSGPGVLVSAIRGRGVRVRPLSVGALLPATPVPRREPVADLSALRFVDNLKPAEPHMPDPSLFSARLGAPYYRPAHLHSTQLRYISLALGLRDAVARVPRLEYGPECVWDHAGGRMICEEVGVEVRDARGAELDLSLGRNLDRNWGIVAAVKGAREEVQRVVIEVLSEFPLCKSILEEHTTYKI